MKYETAEEMWAVMDKDRCDSASVIDGVLYTFTWRRGWLIFESGDYVGKAKGYAEAVDKIKRAGSA